MGSGLGTLTLDLIAKTGNFLAGLTKAERATKNFEIAVAKNAKIAGAAFAGLATVTAGATVAMVNHYRAVIDENAKAAAQVQTSYSSFVTLKQAADEAGIGMAGLMASSRTLNRELGSAIAGNEKSANAFKRLGLEASEVAKIPLDERIGVINKALVDNIDVSQRAAAAAEIYGSKNAAAMLALNADSINSAAEALDVYGLRLSDIDANKVEAANDSWARMGLMMQGVGTQLTVELAPIMTAISQLFYDTAKEAGGLGEAVPKAVGYAVKALAFMANAADGVKRVFQLAADSIIYILSDIATSASYAALQAVRLIDKIPGVNMSKQVKSILDFNITAQSVTKQAAENIAKTLNEPLYGEKLLEFYDKSQEAAEEAGKQAVKQADINKQTGKIYSDVADNKVKAIKDLIKQYELEVAVLGMSTRESVLYKAALDGATASQLKQLGALLSTVDAFESAKKASEDYKSTIDGLRTEEEKRTDTLREQLSIIKAVADVSSAEKNKNASRAAQEAVKTDAPKFAGSDSSLGEFYRFNEQEKELNNWYTKQIAMLGKFREEFAEQSAEWDTAELEAKKYHTEQLEAIDVARRDLLLATTEDMFGTAAEAIKKYAGENSKIYRAMFIAEKAAGIARASIAIQTGIAQAAANPFPMNLAAMASVIAATAGIIGNISAIGMAHDGIQSVPKTGTWLLEKGERVMTSKTSAKMDGMLNDAARGGGFGGVRNAVNQVINVVGEVSNYTAAQIARRTSQQQQIATARLG